MTTLEQRVARLEGGYEHLATKADLSKMESSLNKMESSLIKWTGLWLAPSWPRPPLLWSHHRLDGRDGVRVGPRIT